MHNTIELLSTPWHWSVSGAAIAAIMFLLLYSGKEFGVSSNLRTMCTIAGAGKKNAFFRFDWREQSWNLLFIGGAVIGGYLASTFLASPEPVAISSETQEYLSTLGVDYPATTAEGTGFLPQEIFAAGNMFGVRNLMMLIGGGFLVGFGTRYAGGCTSGHAISGLANLQLPSLIAVIGFFIGGLLMSWVLLPLILGGGGLPT